MSTVKEMLERFRSTMNTVENQREAEELFRVILAEAGHEEKTSDFCREHQAIFLDPLHMSYPKVSRQERWFVLRPYDGGSNFLFTVGGHLFPLDLRVTKARRTPSWGNRITPSIGAYAAGELETGDFTLLLCGPYTHRSEKRLLKELQEEHRVFTKKLDDHRGAQRPHSSLVFGHAEEEPLIYDSPRRVSREAEAHMLMAHLEGNR